MAEGIDYAKETRNFHDDFAEDKKDENNLVTSYIKQKRSEIKRESSYNPIMEPGELSFPDSPVPSEIIMEGQGLETKE